MDQLDDALLEKLLLGARRLGNGDYELVNEVILPNPYEYRFCESPGPMGSRHGKKTYGRVLICRASDPEGLPVKVEVICQACRENEPSQPEQPTRAPRQSAVAEPPPDLAAQTRRVDEFLGELESLLGPAA